MAMMSGGDGATAQIMQEPPPAVAAGPVAPFVAKTYRMVDDPSTDAVISWGPANNSILVADPFAFARTLLPAYFEHCNFSSFVRQLNTYGFRKVDPDRWEFAHVAFLRGQTHLLHRVVRQRKAGGKRRHDGAGAGSAVMDEEGAAARQLVMEVVQLKREQKANEELLAAMCRRVHEIERRPKQTLAFLLKAAGDPQVLRRVLAGTGGRGSHGIGGGSRNSAEPEGRGPFKSARLLHDCDRRRLSCSGGEADGAAGSRFDGVQGGGGCAEDAFDLTGFLTNGGSEDTGVLTNGGSEDGRLMPLCTSPAESGY